MINKSPYTQHIVDHQSERREQEFKQKALAAKLRELVGVEKAQEICLQAIKVSKTEQELADNLRFEYNRAYALQKKCQCGNCIFIRKQYAYIASQRTRLELEEMTGGYMVSVMESINHETDRMNNVIREGCNVNKE